MCIQDNEILGAIKSCFAEKNQITLQMVRLAVILRWRCMLLHFISTCIANDFVSKHTLLGRVLLEESLDLKQ